MFLKNHGQGVWACDFPRTYNILFGLDFDRVAAIRDGLGMGFVACFMGARDASLERIDLPFPEASSNLWMLIHIDLRTNPRVRAFVDFVYEGLAVQLSDSKCTSARPGWASRRWLSSTRAAGLVDLPLMA